MDGRTSPARQADPASAVGVGMSFIPADRRRDGIAPEMSVDRNMMLLVVLHASGKAGALRNRAAAGHRRRAGRDVRHAAPAHGDARRHVERRQRPEGRAGQVAGDRPRCCCCTSRRRVSTSPPAPRSTGSSRGAEGGMSVVWVSSDFDELAAVATGSSSSAMASAERTRSSGTDITPEAITDLRLRRGRRDWRVLHLDSGTRRPTMSSTQVVKRHAAAPDARGHRRAAGAAGATVGGRRGSASGWPCRWRGSC